MRLAYYEHFFYFILCHIFLNRGSLKDKKLQGVGRGSARNVWDFSHSLGVKQV